MTAVNVPCSSVCTIYPIGEARRVFNAPRGTHVIDCTAGDQEVIVVLDRRGRLVCQLFWRAGTLTSTSCQ